MDSVIINYLFLCAPGKFESPQTVVFAIGAPKVYSFQTGVNEKLDGMPYDKVICAKFLKPSVRGTVLVYSVVSELEEYRGGNCLRSAPCENDESETRLDDVLVDVAEK